MREPSASALALAAICAHPWTSGIRWPEEHSDAGSYGTAVHRGIEALVTRAPVFPWVLAGLSESERRTLFASVELVRQYLLEQWEANEPVSGDEAEVWIRYEVATGKARRCSRFDAREPGWWTCVIDHVSLRSDGVLVVRDWKTGRQANTAGAESNPQVRLCAVAAAALWGASRVRVELVYVSEDGLEVDAAEFGPFELGLARVEMRELRATLVRGPTPPVPGTHCTTHFCRMRGVCAATVSALAATQPLEQPLSAQIRDEDHARYILERLPGAQAALDEIRHAVAEYARHTPVHLADGKVYAWHETTRRTVNVDTAEQRAALAKVLGEHGTTAVQMSYETTIGAIEAAAKKKLAADGETKGAAALVRQALAALEAVGGLTVSTWQKPEARAVKQ